MTAPSTTASQAEFCDSMSTDNVTSELPSDCDTPIPINRISAEHGQIKPVSHHFKNDGHSHKHMQFSRLEGYTTKFESGSTTKRRCIELCCILNLHSLTPIGNNQLV